MRGAMRTGGSLNPAPSRDPRPRGSRGPRTMGRVVERRNMICEGA